MPFLIFGSIDVYHVLKDGSKIWWSQKIKDFLHKILQNRISFTLINARK